ncbi:MAG: SDR family NAD(P)-dependent oxidoreductase [Anaerolineae bacterium]
MGGKALSDKIAIVTGSSSGIGRATALALAREGAHVALGARDETALEDVARAIRTLGREALIVPTDVTQQEQGERLVAETLARWGHVDVFVANAGQYVRCCVPDLTIAHFERAMAVNFYGALHGVLAVLPHMLACKSGHVVLVSSVDGKKGLPIDTPYVATKFALAGVGEVMRQELRGTGLHVTTVFPGRIDTPLLDGMRVPWISPKYSPEMVARAIVRGIRRRQLEVIVPAFYRWFVILGALSPRLSDWFVRVSHLEGWEAAER